MQRLSFAFFTAAALCGLAGMIWGSKMGASGDHSALAAHAHLNLLGWVGLAIMGGFHALAAGKVPRAVGWTNFALSAAGAVLMPAGMVLMTGAGGRGFLPLLIAGSMSSILGMTAFLASVAFAWRGAARMTAVA